MEEVQNFPFFIGTLHCFLFAISLADRPQDIYSVVAFGLALALLAEEV
jgi:hypothetical protein